jgi:hypothetical protein
MKEYRQNSHSYSLVFWALLCTATAVFIFIHSHHLISRRLRIEETLVGVMFLILGPAAMAAYLVRARAVWVSLAADGLVISGGRTIPWKEMREVSRRRPLLRKTTGPAQVAEFKGADTIMDASGGCINPGCLAGFGEVIMGVLLIAAFAVAVWLVFFVFVPLVILPVLEVFTPFGDVIKIRMGRRTLVLRDLSDADEFMAKIGERVRVARL